jgi:hypothetical protein
MIDDTGSRLSHAEHAALHTQGGFAIFGMRGDDESRDYR